MIGIMGKYMRRYMAIFLFIIPSLLCAGELPENSHPNIYGDGWTCDKGYYRSGQKCEKVIIPENAHLNYFGNGWTCDKGYYRSGQKCGKVIVPENAHLNYFGNGWECDKAYKKLNNTCIRMTKEEIEKQNALERKLSEKMKGRKAQEVTSGRCETEYKTNAQVCVKMTGADLHCNKSVLGNYYGDCDATLSYTVDTDYSGGSSLDVEVGCTIEIEYKGRQTNFTQLDSDRQDESHTLHAYGSNSETKSFNFSFSPLTEVYSVKISSAECEIESVDLW